MSSKNVLVVGAGVSGLTTALKLLQAGHKVTLWCKEAAGEFAHTSYHAYAMWVPVKIDSDPRIERWANETFAELKTLSSNVSTGVTMVPIVVLKPEQSEPWYASTAPSFRHATQAELTADYADGHVLDSAPVVDPPKYLAWLSGQVTSLGGQIVQHEIASWTDCPAEFDVIINCAGLGAKQLTGDQTLFGERVQTVTLTNTGLNRVVIDDEGANKRACVVPHAGYIKAGALFDGEHATLEVDDQATDDILRRCSAMVPGLQADRSNLLSVVRALRPERPCPRVEVEKLDDGRSLVHNYGHDGMGYILSYGIGAEVAGYLKSL